MRKVQESNPAFYRCRRFQVCLTTNGRYLPILRRAKELNLRRFYTKHLSRMPLQTNISLLSNYRLALYRYIRRDYKERKSLKRLQSFRLLCVSTPRRQVFLKPATVSTTNIDIILISKQILQIFFSYQLLLYLHRTRLKWVSRPETANCGRNCSSLCKQNRFNSKHFYHVNFTHSIGVSRNAASIGRVVP